MEKEVKEVNGYVQDTDGKWILSERAKAESLAMYYSGRVAYNAERSHPVGTYSPTGEVIPYVTWPSNKDKSAQ